MMDPTSQVLYSTCVTQLGLVQRFKDSTGDDWKEAVREVLQSTLLLDGLVDSAAKQEVLQALKAVDLVPEDVFNETSQMLLKLLIKEMKEGCQDPHHHQGGRVHHPG